MAGTNNSIKNIDALTPPVIILVRPQLGENIGMCARAMLNCAVTDMRIVAPRDGWPNPDAQAAASGALMILENARVFDTLAEAVADLEYVIATTARGRDMVKDIYTADAAAKVIHQKHAGATQPKCGILFGPERTGLENDDLAVADAALTIPLNPSFSSLNLAQAVLLVSHAWLACDNPFKTADVQQVLGDTEPAKKEEIENLLRHLEDDLEAAEFFRSPDQRPTLMRNIRNFFFRSGMTAQETRTLHGIFKALTGGRGRKKDA